MDRLEEIKKRMSQGLSPTSRQASYLISEVEALRADLTGSRKLEQDNSRGWTNSVMEVGELRKEVGRLRERVGHLEVFGKVAQDGCSSLARELDRRDG